MKKRTHTPVVREYENPHYAVWTTAPRGTAPSSKEVIIALSKAALAKKIGLDFGDLLTKVQVIKKGPKRFVLWVTVVDDNIYPFVESFNSSKKMSGCKAALKHNGDCAKKVVLHRSYQLARTMEPSDLTSGAQDGSGGPRNESLKKGSKQHSKKRMTPVA